MLVEGRIDDMSGWKVRYRIVCGLDTVLRKLFGDRDLPGVCNLERRMYWGRIEALNSETDVAAGEQQ